MQCVTESEIDAWLHQRSIPKDPYSGDTCPEFYVQFSAPSTHRQMEAFARHYFLNIIPEAESLIHMTDWGLYEPSQMIAITGIRGSRGEDRWLIDAPGHHLNPEEVELGISLFSLSASFAWSSYLYSPNHRSTLYCWEGDIFDFWTDSAEVFTEMKLLVTQHNLTETTRE